MSDAQRRALAAELARRAIAAAERANGGGTVADRLRELADDDGRLTIDQALDALKENAMTNKTDPPPRLKAIEEMSADEHAERQAGRHPLNPAYEKWREQQGIGPDDPAEPDLEDPEYHARRKYDQ